MEADLTLLEEALTFFIRSYSRPRYWEIVRHGAGVTIDRPGAHLLRALQDHPEGYQLNELAGRIGVEAPSVTRTVQRLEEDALVTRTADPHDRRVSRLKLTRQGQRMLERLRRAKRQHMEALFTGWRPAERHELAVLLHRLAMSAAAASDQTL